jgi:hypothetical protein
MAWISVCVFVTSRCDFGFVMAVAPVSLYSHRLLCCDQVSTQTFLWWDTLATTLHPHPPPRFSTHVFCHLSQARRAPHCRRSSLAARQQLSPQLTLLTTNTTSKPKRTFVHAVQHHRGARSNRLLCKSPRMPSKTKPCCIWRRWTMTTSTSP